MFVTLRKLFEEYNLPFENIKFRFTTNQLGCHIDELEIADLGGLGEGLFHKDKSKMMDYRENQFFYPEILDIEIKPFYITSSQPLDSSGKYISGSQWSNSIIANKFYKKILDCNL